MIIQLYRYRIFCQVLGNYTKYGRSSSLGRVFEIRTHKRVVEIIEPTQKTIGSSMHLEIPAGVDIEVKM